MRSKRVYISTPFLVTIREASMSAFFFLSYLKILGPFLIVDDLRVATCHHNVYI